MPHQRVLGLLEYANEITPVQGVQFHADGEPTLQLGQKVRWFGDVERSRRNEQDMVRFHGPILGLYGGALHDGSRSLCTPSRETSGPPRPLF